MGCHIETFTAFEFAIDLGVEKSKRSTGFNRNRSNFWKFGPTIKCKKNQKLDSSRSHYLDFQYETSTGFNRNQ